MGWYRFYVEMFRDWPVGTIVAILSAVAAAILVLLILSGLFVAADSWFLSHKKGTGKVLEKEFAPAHTDLILMYNPATKTSLPQPIHHSEKWSLLVELGGKSAWISVPKKCYADKSIGDRVSVTYVTGRLSGDLYLRSLK